MIKLLFTNNEILHRCTGNGYRDEYCAYRNGYFIRINNYLVCEEINCPVRLPYMLVAPYVNLYARFIDDSILYIVGKKYTCTSRIIRPEAFEKIDSAATYFDLGACA